MNFLERRPWPLGSRPWSLLDKQTLMRIVRRITRIVTSVLGVSALFVAHGLYAYDSQAFGRFPVWTVWPLFLGAGVSILGWTIRPHSVALAYWSGVLSILSCVGRGIGTVAFYLVQRYPLKWPNVELLLGQNMPTLALVFAVWFFLVVPLAKTLAEDRVEDEGEW